jgi:hypothetical protein
LIFEAVLLIAGGKIIEEENKRLKFPIGCGGMIAKELVKFYSDLVLIF